MYYLLAGDSFSGKTILAVTCFAEACISKYFRKYRKIYDNVEAGCLMDLDHLFSEKVADSIEPPAVDEDGGPVYSTTIEEFYYHVDDAVQTGKPFIYVLDSMDSLLSEQQEDKFAEQKKAHRKGKETPGSYGDGKAKKNSEHLRKVVAGLRATGSILIILAQTRDNMGGGFSGKTRAGGRALRFYATCEIWTSIKSTLKKIVRGKPRKVGTQARLEVKKNRTTGKLSAVDINIYPSYGIDDVGSMVEYLLSEKWWTKKGGKYLARPLGVFAARTDLAKAIEDADKVEELKQVVADCWATIDRECNIERRRRYEI